VVRTPLGGARWFLPRENHPIPDDAGQREVPLQQFVAQVERTFAPLRHAPKPPPSDPAVMVTWALLVGVSAGILWWDVRVRNRALPSATKGVWTLVVLYSGPFGLAVSRDGPR
jgi:hypothetical protein